MQVLLVLVLVSGLELELELGLEPQRRPQLTLEPGLELALGLVGGW
jgi:hypothetical protein